MNEEILAEIREFLAESGMPRTTFGKRACNNTYVVHRLEDGRPIQTDTAERIRAYIAERRAARAQATEAAE